MFVSRPAGEDTELGTLRFDASEPRLMPSVLVPGYLNKLEAARDRRAILLSMLDGLADGYLYWISYSKDGEPSEPRLLLEKAIFLSIQP